MNISPKPKKIIIGLVVFVGFYLASFATTYAALGFLNQKEEVSLTPLADLKDITSQKPQSGDQPCPLNGVKFTKEQKEAWDQRRPLGVMIENHVDARPQSGLSRADVVYEAVAEGGITRFLAMFYCQDAGDLTPVRSARMYYLEWLSEYGDHPLYAHVGGANTPGPADALGTIRDLGWARENDMDQFSLGFPTYWRGADRFAPHNVHSTTQKLWEAAKGRGYTEKDPQGKRWDENFSSWLFKDEAALDTRAASASAQVNFWQGQGDYAVEWQYDKGANNYKRIQGGSVQKDALTEEELTPKVVVVQFAKELQVYDGYTADVHLSYKTTGSGDGVIFQNGKAEEVTWRKKDREDRTRFFDVTGREIEFNRGQIWIQVVPVGAEVKY